MSFRSVRSKSPKENSRELTAPGTCNPPHRGPSLPSYSPLICAALSFCIASSAWANPFFNATLSYSTPHPSVVRVAVPERDGTAYGSGSLVAVDDTSGLVLTNWHVVRDAAGPIVVYFPDGFKSRAYVLRVDQDWDLAALAIRRPNVQPIPLAAEAPQFGDPLTIIGYGSGSYRVMTGRCTQYVSPGGNHPFEMVELSAPARNGDSGGPILNARGELAGVLFGSAFGRTTGSYCGRVRGFVTTVEGDFRSFSNRVMLVDQAHGAGTPVAAVSTASNQQPEALASMWSPSNTATAPLTSLPTRSTLPTPPTFAGVSSPSTANPAVDAGRTCSVPGPIAAIPSTGPMSMSDQLKTVLALIGTIAVLYHAIRLLGAAVG